MIERFNGTLQRSLEKYSVSDNQSWDTFLPFCLLAYRTRCHSSTGYSPYYVVFGVPCPLENFDQCETDENSRIQEIEDVELVRIDARKRLYDAQQRMKLAHDSKLLQKDCISAGDYVLQKNSKPIRSKLEPLWNGPYKVSHSFGNTSFVLVTADGKVLRTVHRDQIKLSKYETIPPIRIPRKLLEDI